MYRLQLLLIGVNDGVPSPPLLSFLGDTPPFPLAVPFSSPKCSTSHLESPLCVLVSVWFCFNLGCGKEDGREVLRLSSCVALGWGCLSCHPGTREVQGRWQGRGNSLTQQPRAIPIRCLCTCCSPSHLGTSAWEVPWGNQGGCRQRLQRGRAECEPGMSHQVTPLAELPAEQ